MTRNEYQEELLKQYRLVDVLSKKNGCTTMRLRHKTMGKDLVLHSFPKAYSAYDELCRLRCENLPEILDSVALSDGQIVLEEFIDGLTLTEVMETERYTYQGAKKVILALCDALWVLHSKGFVHRDVKPDNVIITAKGRIVLVDFNASRKISDANKDTEIMGTVGYASPEQLGIAQSDERTDLYALGVLLNVMLTGMHPSKKMASGKAGRIVRRCTSVNPNDRYQSAIKLAWAL